MRIKIPFTKRSLDVGLSPATEAGWKGGFYDIDGGLASGAVTEKQAMRLSAVYACIQLYARTIGCLPLGLYKKQTQGKEKAEEHYLYKILHDEPNPIMTSTVFRQTLVANQKAFGNAYAWIEFDAAWKVKALWPIKGDCCYPRKDLATGRVFYQATFDQKSVLLEDWEVLHFPCVGFDGIAGISPIRQAAEAMGLGLDVQRFGRKFFQNGARPSGVLEHPGELSEEAQDRLEHKFDREYSGLNNAAKTVLLEEGMKYKPISIAPEEAQFLESRKFSVTEIARIYMIPPHMIGDLDKATFSNIEAQDINFAKHTILPELVLWEQELKKKLLNKEEAAKYTVNFNIDGLVRADYKTRYEGYAIGKQNGFLSTNDIRNMENMNLVADGDGYYVPVNMMPDQLAAAFWASKVQESKLKGGE